MRKKSLSRPLNTGMPFLTQEISEPQTTGSGGVFRRNMTVYLICFYTVCKLLQLAAVGGRYLLLGGSII